MEWFRILLPWPLPFPNLSPLSVLPSHNYFCLKDHLLPKYRTWFQLMSTTSGSLSCLSPIRFSRKPGDPISLQSQRWDKCNKQMGVIENSHSLKAFMVFHLVWRRIYKVVMWLKANSNIVRSPQSVQPNWEFLWSEWRGNSCTHIDVTQKNWNRTEGLHPCQNVAVIIQQTGQELTMPS